MCKFNSDDNQVRQESRQGSLRLLDARERALVQKARDEAEKLPTFWLHYFGLKMVEMEGCFRSGKATRSRWAVFVYIWDNEGAHT